MINWDYRVFREPEGDYVIREVFYAEDGSILGCTESEVSPTGRTLVELTEDIEAFATALHKPALTLADIPISEKKIEGDREGKNNLSHDRLLSELGLTRSKAIG